MDTHTIIFLIVEYYKNDLIWDTYKTLHTISGISLHWYQTVREVLNGLPQVKDLYNSEYIPASAKEIICHGIIDKLAQDRLQALIKMRELVAGLRGVIVHHELPDLQKMRGSICLDILSKRPLIYIKYPEILFAVKLVGDYIVDIAQKMIDEDEENRDFNQAWLRCINNPGAENIIDVFKN